MTQAPAGMHQRTYDAIIRTVSDLVPGVTIEDIFGKSRFDPIVRARHLFVYALRSYGLGVVHIGKHMGRDHTTIMYAVDKLKGYAQYDEWWLEALRQVDCALCEEHVSN